MWPVGFLSCIHRHVYMYSICIEIHWHKCLKKYKTAHICRICLSRLAQIHSNPNGNITRIDDVAMCTKLNEKATLKVGPVSPLIFSDIR